LTPEHLASPIVLAQAFGALINGFLAVHIFGNSSRHSLPQIFTTSLDKLPLKNTGTFLAFNTARARVKFVSGG
jgi:hypothetical protein